MDKVTNSVAPEQNVRHRVHNSPHKVPILSQMNPLNPPANLSKNHSDPL
jgi:hypothetical protein